MSASHPRTPIFLSSGSCRAAARTWDESFVVESVVGRGASGDGGEGGRDEAKQHTDAKGPGVLLHTTAQGGRSVLAPTSEIRDQL
jgi:hypothetical protein